MDILTNTQKGFLKLFGSSQISRDFYLSGGTALAGFYIPYRLSDDLDFFSEKEVEVDGIIAFLTKFKKTIGFKSYEYNTSFNRNLFFLFFSKNTLKLEFTFYPFPQINPPKTQFGVKIDSIEDIATNKLFTIYQKPRSRDFMDLFMIVKKYGFTINDLVKKAKIKFDFHVDLLKLGSQFLLVKELKDYPKLLNSLEDKDWQNFFLVEAKRLGQQIIEK